MTKSISSRMTKAELLEELEAISSRLEKERNAFDQLAMVSAKHETDLGEVFALLAEAHGLRQEGGYDGEGDVERWSAWDRRTAELLQLHRDGSPLPFRTAEEAELALERMTAERDAWKERAETRRSPWKFWDR